MKFKKVLSLVLAFAMVLSLSFSLMFTSSAVDRTFNGTLAGSGENERTGVKWAINYVVETEFSASDWTRITSRTYTLDIYANENSEDFGIMRDYNYEGNNVAPWLRVKEIADVNKKGEITRGANDIRNFKTITVHDGVENIGDNAFNPLNYAEVACDEIKLADTIKTIGRSAFRDLNINSGNGTLTLPRQLITIGEWAFNALKCGTIKFSDNIEEIGDNAFRIAQVNSGKVILPQNIEKIGDYAFQQCANLEEVTITEKMTTMGQYVFLGCQDLKRINILVDNVEKIDMEDNTFSGVPSNVKFCILSGSGFKELLVERYRIPTSNIFEQYKVTFLTEGYSTKILGIFNHQWVQPKTYKTVYGYKGGDNKGLVTAPQVPGERGVNFKGWEIVDSEKENESYIFPERNMTVRAVFELKPLGDRIIDFIKGLFS